MKIELHTFSDDGLIPNNNLPVIVYRGACEEEDIENWLFSTFQANNWTNNWKDIILRYDHFHSNTHEVLGLAKGTAKLMIGGKNGKILEFSAGDVIVMPAGVGHFSVSDNDDYLFVGGYPNGATWDLLTGTEPNRETILSKIKSLPFPENDPLFGKMGQLHDSWKNQTSKN